MMMLRSILFCVAQCTSPQRTTVKLKNFCRGLKLG